MKNDNEEIPGDPGFSVALSNGAERESSGDFELVRE